MSTPSTFIQNSFGHSRNSNQRRKRNKGNPNWKRRSEIVTFADDTLYKENPKGVTRKLLELINEVGNVAGYKINTQKSIIIIYSKNKGSEKAAQEIIPFTISSKRIKYLGIILCKQVNDLYSES